MTGAALMAILRRNPLVSLLVVLLMTQFAYGQVRDWQRARDHAAEVKRLETAIEKQARELETRVKTITQDDLVALKARNEVITRQLDTMLETIKMVSGRQGGTVVIERDVSAKPIPGPAGQPGTPAAPGKDGKDGTPGKDGVSGQPGTPGVPGQPAAPTGPLIPEAQAPAARAGAIERVLVDFVPGSLLNCDTVGLDANQVELLRDPTGRLASTARCVYRIRDQIRLEPAPVSTVASRWSGRAYLGYGSSDHILSGVRANYRLSPTTARLRWSLEAQAECRKMLERDPQTARTMICGASDFRTTLGLDF